MIDISLIQILIVLAIALIVFGPSKLPDMARSVGRGIREFRAAIYSRDDGPPSRGPEAPPEEGDAGDLDGVIVPGGRRPG
jgi:sec-independent protein translocase protein TatA